MDSPKFFLVWNGARSNRRTLLSPPQVKEVLSRASEKMQYECKTLVLEENGSIIDDDEYLLYSRDCTIFLALKDGEVWEPQEKINTPPHSHTESLPTQDQNSSRIHEDSDDMPESSRHGAQLSDLNVREQRQYWRTFNGMEIPWEEFPSGIMSDLHEKKKLTITQKRQVRRIMVNKVRKINHYGTSDLWRNIAKKICDKYPKSFQDEHPDGTITATGYLGLATMMRNLNTDLNRSHMIKTQEHEMHRQSKRVKRDNNLWAGNVENSPNIDSDNEEDLFPKVRREINKRGVSITKVPEVIQIYDFLKDEDEIIKHFNRLTQTDAHTLLIRIEEDYAIIFEACNLMKNRESPPRDHNVEALIKKLGKYFKEDPNQIIIHNEAGTTKTVLENKEGVNYPTIEIIDNDPPEIWICCQGVALHATEDMRKAILLLLIDFHVFNFIYPKKTSRILEFLQRYFLKIQPDLGTRSQAPVVTGINLKVLTLINKITSIYNQNMV
ncbi:hypothetical protein DMENIID0001_005340 [Sergentomyia squamirostris]